MGEDLGAKLVVRSVLYLDRDCGYMTVFFCKNSQDYEHKKPISSM